MKKPVNVLLVDDDSVMLEWWRIVLPNKKYQVIGDANNGIEAIALSEKLQPDLVLLDIGMPEKSGLEALEEMLKASPASKVLIITGDATMKNYEEAIRKGAKGFVVKPFNVEKTLEMIDGFFNEHEKV